MSRRSSPLRRAAGSTLLLAVLLVAAAAPAAAHTSLATSTPAAGATVATPPASARLEFEKPVDPRTLTVRLLDGAGAVVADGVRRVTPDRPDTRTVDLALSGLGTGTFAIEWRTVGGDGHVARGEVVFHVGAAVGGSAPADVLPAGDGTPGSDGVPAGGGVARALWYAAVSLLAGALWLRRSDCGARRVSDRLVTLGALAGIAGAAGRGAAVVAAVVTSGSASGLGARLLDGYTTAAATPWWIAAAGAGLLLARRRRDRPIPDAALGAAVAAGAALTVIHGHAAGDLTTLVVRALHVAGAIAWVGPLAAITVVLGTRSGTADVRRLLARFAPMAAWSFGALLLTGVHLAWSRAGSGILETSYGAALLAKSAVVAYVLVPLGWYHHRVARRSSAGSAAPGRGFLRTARLELVAMAAVLVAAGVLSGLDPTGGNAPPAAAAPQPPGPAGIETEPVGAGEPGAATVADCAALAVGRLSCYETAFVDVLRRDGAEAAIAAIEATGEADTEVRGDCHRLTHVVGRAAAELYDDVAEAFSFEASACWSGYYHGYLEEALAPYGDEELQAALPELCAAARAPAYGFSHYNCVHGLGHGMFIRLGGDLFGALSACEELAEEWEVAGCAGGAFMQNVVAAQDGSAAAVRDDDPLYPCTAVADRHREACYQMQTSYVLWRTGFDYRAGFSVCDGAEDGYRDDCYRSMGRDISGAFLLDADKVVATCALGREEHLGDCYDGAARNAVYNDAGIEAATALCEAVEAGHRRRCETARDEAAATL